MMPIVTGYTDLAPQTAALLSELIDLHWPVVSEDVSGSDEAYYWLLRRYWEHGQGLIVLEQDILPSLDQLQQLIDCPQEWCAFRYPYSKFGLYAGSGCCKFSAGLMQREPLLMERVGTHASPPWHPYRHWCTIDAFSQGELHRAGVIQHIHEPPVQHLRPTISHGCQPDS